jgi:hypothetical protein
MATRGRPRKLTAGLIEALVFNTELTGSVEAGARATGVAPRSLRRWRSRGCRELAALSLEARLVLALDRAERRSRALTWEEAAARLEASYPERWRPAELPSLDDLLGFED